MIYIHISNGNPGPLILSIRKDLDGDDLYNYSMTVEQERFHFKIGKAYTFELPDIEVTPGEKYWIVLKSNGDSGANSYAIPRAKDHYPDGELAYSADGHTWNNYSNSDDMYFSILGRPVDDPPVKPDKPSLSGISRLKYTFSTSTTDPDGDQIYYKWDWGDDICSDWLGPYDSGETVEASHTFKKEDIYSVRVKASDPYCAKSDWSDPLSVNMPNQNSQSSQSSSQQSLSPPFPLQILEQRTGCFPLLERLPSRIVN